MSNIKTFDTANFSDETRSGVSIVDFYADWCGPCKALAPTVGQLAEKHSGQVTVGKIDVDSNRELAQQFGVRSIPTVIAFKDGKEVERVSGNVPLESLEHLVHAAKAA